MPTDGPTIYIDKRPYTPTERIVGSSAPAGYRTPLSRFRYRTKVIDKVTISKAARRMYDMTYGTRRSCMGTKPLTYSRQDGSNPRSIVPSFLQTRLSTPSNDK